MRPLPSGTVTMLFSDIENSTITLKRLGARWGEALSKHRQLLRTAFAAHDGVEMGTEGDSFFVVFSSAREAVRAAVEGQQMLFDEDWPDGVPLRVRMGLHTGEPSQLEGGYLGLDVHRAARIAATAHGGQIVLSMTTAQLSEGAVAGAVQRDLGWHRLKDLDTAEHLVDLVVQGLPVDFPPLRSLGATASLPVPATGLVGRRHELAHLCDLLAGPECRLVTLTGPGGTGKTRLALAVASELASSFADGVFFVDLHAADRASLMAASIAETLGAPGGTDEGPDVRIARFLAGRRLLLLLDNLEQIPDADEVVARLLSAAEQTAVLATSRRPLHLVAEHEFPVPPLEVPEPAAAQPSVQSVETCSAVELFVKRAQMVDPRFQLTGDNVADVVALCRRLDALPLAIELAAARCRLLSPRALLGRIDDRLGVGVTAVDRTERQRTLGTTIAWSYDLLDETDRRVFRRLGVFARAFEVDAVDDVVGTAGVDTLEVLARLIDVSLLQAAPGPDGEPRLSMLQTIRRFARRRLKDEGEYDDMRLRHARWCLRRAVKIRDKLKAPTPVTALDLANVVQEDIRAALDWCLQPASKSSRERLELGYQLIAPMNVYWHRFGYAAEGRGWLSRAIAMAEDRDSVGLVDALHGMAVLELQQDDVEEATSCLERALDMARRLGDAGLQAREANSLGAARRSAGDPAGARDLLEESIRLSRQIGNLKKETTALTNLAVVLMDDGAYGDAVAVIRQAIANDERTGDNWGAALNRANLTMALLRAEGPRAAFDHLEQTASADLALDDPELSAFIVELLAACLAELGLATDAVTLLGAADRQRDRVGMPRSAPDQEFLDASLKGPRTSMSADEWSVACSTGRALTPAAALELGLSTGGRVASSRVG